MIVRGRPFGISWNHFDLEPEAGRELLHDEANLTFDLRYLLDIATGLMCRHSDSDPQRPRRVVDVEDVDIVLGEGGGHVGENASTASSALHADREVSEWSLSSRSEPAARGQRVGAIEAVAQSCQGLVQPGRARLLGHAEHERGDMELHQTGGSYCGNVAP